MIAARGPSFIIDGYLHCGIFLDIGWTALVRGVGVAFETEAVTGTGRIPRVTRSEPECDVLNIWFIDNARCCFCCRNRLTKPRYGTLLACSGAGSENKRCGRCWMGDVRARRRRLQASLRAFQSFKEHLCALPLAWFSFVFSADH